MNELLITLLLVSVLFLGIANVLLLFNNLRSGTRLERSVIGFLCLGAAIMCYFLGRAGFVSGKQWIASDQIAPFYGTEWYFLFAIGLIAFVYQMIVMRKHKKTNI